MPHCAPRGCLRAADHAPSPRLRAAQTPIHVGMNNTGWLRVAWNGVRPLFSSPEKGADTVVFLACDADVQGTNGAYWARRKPRRPGARGRDDEMAARLWEATEALAGIPGSSE